MRVFLELKNALELKNSKTQKLKNSKNNGNSISKNIYKD